MSVFKKAVVGCNQDVNYPSTLERLARPFQRILMRTTELPRVEDLNQKPRLKLSKEFHNGTTVEMAPMDIALVSDFRHPIGTDGLICCVGFGIVDTERKKQVVGHISARTEIKRLLAFLRQFEHAGVSVFLREGPADGGILLRTYNVFSQTAVANIAIIESGSSLMLFDGEIYNISAGQRTRREHYLKSDPVPLLTFRSIPID